MLKANPKEFDLIDKRKLPEADTWAYLAVCGEEVFIRDLVGLTVWRWTGK